MEFAFENLVYLLSGLQRLHTAAPNLFQALVSSSSSSSFIFSTKSRFLLVVVYQIFV